VFTDTFADRIVAERSILIRNMLEDLGDEQVIGQAIPIPNVSPPTSVLADDLTSYSY
jgi:hypothetical protein